MNCAHNRDPRSCAVCAPQLVERFQVIGEAFAIVRELGRCLHTTYLAAGPWHVCHACGARRAAPKGIWKVPDVTKRAVALAARADLSNPFKGAS